MPIEGYTSANSVAEGDEIRLHTGGDDPTRGALRFRVVRESDEQVVFPYEPLRSTPSTMPDGAAQVGCDWNVSRRFRIPLDWRSDLYRFEFDGLTQPSLGPRFVVTARNPGSGSSILVMLPSNTYQAYNFWGGQNLYDPPGNRARRVSFNRPADDWVRLLGHEELGFVEWIVQQDIPVEYCTNEDIHRDRGFLGAYQLLLSVGHDEYWSKEMRDNVEDFIAANGNVAFLSGNTCWWQIRYEPDLRQFWCYKDAAEDPLMGVDNDRVTVEWRSCPVRRPENYLTGVSSAHGGGSWNRDYKNTPFVVRAADHWVFAGTGLQNGAPFGASAVTHQNAVGYETDAAQFDPGTLLARGGDGSPTNFRVLASADLSRWAPGGWSGGPVGDTGAATMGIYRRRGTVFTAATTGWVRAIGRHPATGNLPGSPEVEQITRNVLLTLNSTTPPRDPPVPDVAERAWERIGRVKWAHLGPATVRALAAADGKLFAATSDNLLIWRDAVGWDMPSQRIGHATNVNAMTALNGKLFAATTDNRLWWREPVGDDVDWEAIGHADNVRALAALDGKLFAATTNNRLWWRDPVGSNVDWEAIGHADNVRALAALDGKLFAATTNNRLWWREPVGSNVNWEAIGHANRVLAMTSWCHKLFAVDSTNRLWQRDPVR